LLSIIIAPSGGQPATPQSNSPLVWRFTSRQPMNSGATTSAGWAKKDGGGAGRVLVDMGVAWVDGTSSARIYEPTGYSFDSTT